MVREKCIRCEKHYLKGGCGMGGTEYLRPFLKAEKGVTAAASAAKKTKMVYLIGPNGLVNWRFANFHKMVWMTTVHAYNSHPCCFFGNLHTLSLQGMQNISGFVTKSILRKMANITQVNSSE